MKKANKRKTPSPRRPANADDDLLPHYDVRGGVRGKYAARYPEGTNVVVLAPASPPASRTRRPSIALCARSLRLRMPRLESRVRDAAPPNVCWT
jgi:hypothetical protein